MAIGDLKCILDRSISRPADEIDRCATTEDGIIWTERNRITMQDFTVHLQLVIPNGTGKFICIGDQTTPNATAIVQQVNVLNSKQMYSGIFQQYFNMGLRKWIFGTQSLCFNYNRYNSGCTFRSRNEIWQRCVITTRFYKQRSRI